MTAREIFGADADFMQGGDSDELLEQYLQRLGEEGGRKMLQETAALMLKAGPGCPRPEVS